MGVEVEYFESTSEETGKTEYYYRVRAGNGEKMVTSEGYTREADAPRGFRDLVDAILEIEEAERGS